MTSTIIEIHPLKASLDPVAAVVRAELIESGQAPAVSEVRTQRLFKLEGEFKPEELTRIADTLLVDPVVESVTIDTGEKPKKGAKKPAKAKKSGFVLDIWPKPGVTDPVGETVEKGLRDLGFGGKYKASSAMRYVFPKISDSNAIQNLAKRVLANELIHDIHVRKLS